MPKSVEMADPSVRGVENQGVNAGAEGVQTRSSDDSSAPAQEVGARRDGVAAEELSSMDTGDAKAVAGAEGPVVIHSDLMRLVPGPPKTKEQAEREKEVLADDAKLEQTAMQGVTVSLTGLFHKKKDKRSVAEKELDEQQGGEGEETAEGEAPRVA